VTTSAQSTGCDAPLVAGWYGKMPCLGDFAHRRLAPDFIAAWDAWLQRSIATSRQQLGDAWLDSFLTSPMWRFALTPGLCGSCAHIGVVTPSVDKAGRYFPLTLALALHERDSATRAMREESWFGELETIALAALDVGFSIDALERRLYEHPFEQAIGDEASDARELTARWRNTEALPVFHFSSAQALPAAIEAAAYRVFEQTAAGLSFWWCVAPDTGASELHVHVGLPSPDHFRTLMRSPR